MKMHPHGKVSLWVANRHKKNNTPKLHTASGLRFALFMVAVYMGVLPGQNDVAESCDIRY